MGLDNRFVLMLRSSNDVESLVDTLTSLESQSFDDIGLLVADDASSDGSRHVIDQFIARSTRVRDSVVLGREAEGGRLECYADLMQHVANETSVIGLLDPGQRLLNPDAIKRMVTEVERGADAAVSGARVRDLDRRDPAAGEAEGLFCFRACLWERIPLENYRDGDGAWLRTATARCLTEPLREVASSVGRVAELFCEVPEPAVESAEIEGLLGVRGFVATGELPRLGHDAPPPAVDEKLETGDLTCLPSTSPGLDGDIEFDLEGPELAGGDDAAIDLDADDPDLWMPDFSIFDTAAPATVETPEPAAVDETPQSRARHIALRIAYCLSERQDEDGGFAHSEFYGKEFAAALWHCIDPIRYRDAIARALDGSRRRMASTAMRPRAEYHWEYILYASTAMGVFTDPGLRLNNARVVTWQLLLAVIDTRFGLPLREDVVELVAENMRGDGAVYDFNQALVNDNRVSDQNHAFASLLLSELRLRCPDHLMVQELSTKAEAFLGETTRALWSTGSGERTSFGYGAAYRVFARQEDDDMMTLTLDQLELSRWDAELDSVRRCGRTEAGLRGHFDALPFLGLHLAVDPAEPAS